MHETRRDLGYGGRTRAGPDEVGVKTQKESWRCSLRGRPIVERRPAKVQSEKWGGARQEGQGCRRPSLWQQPRWLVAQARVACWAATERRERTWAWVVRVVLLRSTVDGGEAARSTRGLLLHTSHARSTNAGGKGMGMGMGWEWHFSGHVRRAFDTVCSVTRSSSRRKLQYGRVSRYSHVITPGKQAPRCEPLRNRHFPRTKGPPDRNGGIRHTFYWPLRAHARHWAPIVRHQTNERPAHRRPPASLDHPLPIAEGNHGGIMASLAPGTTPDKVAVAEWQRGARRSARSAGSGSVKQRAVGGRRIHS